MFMIDYAQNNIVFIPHSQVVRGIVFSFSLGTQDVKLGEPLTHLGSSHHISQGANCPRIATIKTIERTLSKPFCPPKEGNGILKEMLNLCPSSTLCRRYPAIIDIARIKALSEIRMG
jgi:hypothetical protein